MASNLWDFAVALYSRPSVAQTCLHLQDTYLVNVNLLLFARWLETRQVALGTERLNNATELVADWEANYVKPLRALRRHMKEEFAEKLVQVAPVREQIKKAELAAEKQELQWLEALATQWRAEVSNVPAGENLAVYLKALEVPAAVVAQTIKLIAI